MLESWTWGIPRQPVQTDKTRELSTVSIEIRYIWENICIPILRTESAGPCSKMEWDWMVWGLSLLLLLLVSLFLSSLSLFSFFETMTSSFNLTKTFFTGTWWQNTTWLKLSLIVTHSSLLFLKAWTFGSKVFYGGRENQKEVSRRFLQMSRLVKTNQCCLSSWVLRYHLSYSNILTIQ